MQQNVSFNTPSGQSPKFYFLMEMKSWTLNNLMKKNGEEQHALETCEIHSDSSSETDYSDLEINTWDTEDNFYVDMDNATKWAISAERKNLKVKCT